MTGPREFQSATATIAGCICVAFCEGFDLQAAGVAAVGIAAEFTPTAAQLGTFFSASTLGLTVGAVLGGRLSDSFGRKRTLIISVALFGLFSLLTAATHDVVSLSWARLLTGAGLGGALPNLIALVNESSSERRRSANVALAYSGMPFGGALASLVSLLSSPADWRLIFITGGVAPLLFAPWLLLVLRESLERPDAAAARQRTAAAVAAAGAPPAGSFAAIFAGSRLTVTLLLWGSSFLGLLTLYLLLSWLPTLLVSNGLSKTQAAGGQVAFNAGGGITALIVGHLLEGRARAITILATAIAVPLFVYLLSCSPAQLGLVVAIVFALGCAVIAAQGILYALAPQCYPSPIRGVGVGAAVAMGRLGSIAGPKLGGTLRAAGHGTSQLLLDILPLAAIGSVLALLFAWRALRLRPTPRGG